MVLITGATGFIGKNLAPALIRHVPVRILARRTSNLSHYARFGNIQRAIGDLERNEGLAEALRGVDTVVHCAARTIGRDFWEYYNTNTLGTLHLVQAMRHTGTRRILLLSSHAACGPTRTRTIIDERTPPRPVSQYGRSKALAEHIIRNSGLDFIILRPVAVYGPHDMDMLKYIRLLNAGISPVVGFGDKYVNLIYIHDLVRLITTMVSMGTFTRKTYFIHDGQCYAYETVMKTITGILGTTYRSLRVPAGIALMIGLLNDVFVPERKRLVWRDKVRELAGTCWLCCRDEISRDFTFTPHYDLPRGMQQTIDWYRARHLL